MHAFDVITVYLQSAPRTTASKADDDSCRHLCPCLPAITIVQRTVNSVMGCLHDPADVQQISSKCIQNTRANAGRLLDRVNTLLD